MRELVLKMSVSLDGFVCGPNGELAWIFENSDDAAAAWTIETLQRAGLHAMGSRTFRDMAAHWPTDTSPFAPVMNRVPKVVFSRRTLPELMAAETTRGLEDSERLHTSPPAAAAPPEAASWAQAEVAHGDLAAEVAQLKAQPGGEIVAHGGARFARSLVRLGLVDEYRLLVIPVALGQGQPLFSDLAAPLNLQRVNAIEFPRGAVARIYRPRG